MGWLLSFVTFETASVFLQITYRQTSYAGLLWTMIRSHDPVILVPRTCWKAKARYFGIIVLPRSNDG